MKANQMETTLERIRASIKAKREELASVLREAALVQEQLSRIKSTSLTFQSDDEIDAARAVGDSIGRKDSSALVRFQDRVIQTELELRVSIDQLERKLRSIEQENGATAPSRTQPCATESLPLVTAPSLPSSGARQSTLALFVKRIDDRGNLQSLSGPKFLAQPLDCICEGCDTTFKNSYGLIEHQRHCKAFQQVIEQRQRDLREAKRQRLAGEIARPISSTLVDSNEDDASESSTDCIDALSNVDD